MSKDVAKADGQTHRLVQSVLGSGLMSPGKRARQGPQGRKHPFVRIPSSSSEPKYINMFVQCFRSHVFISFHFVLSLNNMFSWTRLWSVTVSGHVVIRLLNPPNPFPRCAEAIDERSPGRVISEVQAHTALGDSALTILTH